MKRSLIALAALCLAQTAAADAPRVLAEYPSGTFLENLVVAPDRSILATSYFANELLRIAPDGTVTPFAKLPVHPVSILPHGEGWIVTGHGTPFTAGPAFTRTMTILLLDADGKVTDSFATPDALFLNGMVALPDGTVLVADSIAGTIWKIDLANHALTPWLRDPILAAKADQQVFLPGANGLKRSGDWLHVSNSSKGTLHRIRVGADGKPSGALELVAETGPIDDFWIEDRGRIYFATHTEALKLLNPDGTITTVLAEGCGGCTAVTERSGAAGPELIVLTTGGLAAGRTDPARILAVPIN